VPEIGLVRVPGNVKVEFTERPLAHILDDPAKHLVADLHLLADVPALKYPAVVNIVEFIKERTISKQQVHDGVVRRRRLPVTEFPGKNIRIVCYQVVFRPSDDDQAI